jgi:ATP-dependent protease HslVU (ClpYQ) peptidase subunit
VTVVIATEYGLAADSLIDDDGTRSYGDKIFRTSKGDLLGVSGSYHDGLKFVKWYQNKRLRKIRKELGKSDDWECIVLTRKGRVEVWDSNFEPVTHAVPWAIGSGRDPALAAFYTLKAVNNEAWIQDFGKIAVEAAIKVTVGCGGNVQWEELSNV